MTPNNKPEWFQIADNAASTRKISKGLPIMALVAVAAIIGVGALVAQPKEQGPANATQTVAPSVNSNQSSTSPSSLTPAKGSQDSESVAPSTQINNSSIAPKASATPGIANPLGNKPKGGDDEGDEGDDDEGGEDDHEGGEDD